MIAKRVIEGKRTENDSPLATFCLLMITANEVSSLLYKRFSNYCLAFFPHLVVSVLTLMAWVIGTVRYD